MGAPGVDRRPAARPPTWQLVLAAGAASVILVGVTVLAVGGGSDAPVATGGTTTPTTSAPTAPTTPVFRAPPPRPPVTPTAAPVTTTSEPPTTTSTSASTSSTTEAPRPVAARPGPFVETTAGDHGATRAALASARTRWRADAPSRGYTYRTRPICFCPEADNEITVGPDGRVRAQRTIEGAPETDPPTIDQLLSLLEDAVARDAARIRTSFDLRYGYPVAFFVDYDERLADEERGREIDWLAPHRGGS